MINAQIVEKKIPNGHLQHWVYFYVLIVLVNIESMVFVIHLQDLLLQILGQENKLHSYKQEVMKKPWNIFKVQVQLVQEIVKLIIRVLQLKNINKNFLNKYFDLVLLALCEEKLNIIRPSLIPSPVKTVQQSEKSSQNKEEESPIKEQPKQVFQNNLLQDEAIVTKKSNKIVFADNTKPQVVSGKAVQGKKLADVDFDSLQFDDPFSNPFNNDPFKQELNQAELPQQDEPKVIIKSTQQPTQPVTQTNETLEKLKDKNVKSISSETLFQSQDNEQNKQNIYKFNGQTAISSKQFFGEKDEDSEDSSQKMDQFKSMFNFATEKTMETFGTVKEKAGGIWENLKTRFNKQ
ncbi:unnamed protein product [Paramecium sonneborni]|uniref:Uncharacterized protein n=1 Tax=Paramecium sonneborni TaxID=65129 RepID=A0A8S1M3E4_9CILI|nr:unnamed protein product [Paramecium sonneborni]